MRETIIMINLIYKYAYYCKQLFTRCSAKLTLQLIIYYFHQFVMSQQNINFKNQNQNVPITQKTTIKLQQPICYQHNQYYSHLCNHLSCSNNTRLCKVCISKHDNHSKSVRSQEGASKDIKKNLAICLEKIVEMDSRYIEVTNLMKGTKETLSDQEQKMIKELMKELEKDKEILADKFKKIKQLNVYLDQLYRLGKYFKQLNKLNLLNLKIQMSSEIGLTNFKQKNELFAEFIKKDVFQSFKQYQFQYDELTEDFLKVYQNNFTFKLNQIIKMKTSKKEMMRRTREREIKVQEKENSKDEDMRKRQVKCKEHPKSTSNISQGFFNSILNFFGVKK